MNRTQSFLSGGGTYCQTSKEQQKGVNSRKAFRLPYFIGDRADGDVSVEVKSHLVCRGGLNTRLNFGQKRYLNLRNAAKSSSVLPEHKSIGKKNYNAIINHERKYEPLVRHFEYLKNLGEVRATRVVTTLVDGMGGHVNHDDDIDITYLPISMGYHNCYQ